MVGHGPAHEEGLRLARMNERRVEAAEHDPDKLIVNKNKCI